MEKGGEERRQEKTRQKGDEMIGQQDKIGRNGQDNVRKVNKTKKNRKLQGKRRHGKKSLKNN